MKTGTTFEYRDNWAVGFTPERAVGVWVGNADASSTAALSGLAGAAPVWRDVITEATLGRPVLTFEPPPSMVTVTVCAPTGLLPGPHCPSPVSEWFQAGTEPEAIETHYVLGADGALAVHLPAEARPWAGARRRAARRGHRGWIRGARLDRTTGGGGGAVHCART